MNEKLKQIVAAVQKLKAALAQSKNPPIDMKKVDLLAEMILQHQRYEEYREIKFAVLADRLRTNPITNMAIARYVWDLHSMNNN